MAVKVKLIENASAWHRLWSIRFIIMATAFGALEASLPLFKGSIPDFHYAALSTVCALLAGISRVVKQEIHKEHEE